MPKFLKCKHCGQIVGVLKDTGNPIICCGEEMQELIPNTVDAAKEKHVPVLTYDGNRLIVNVGSVDHPMIDAHYIEWIYVETKTGGMRVQLHPGMKPRAEFLVKKEDVVAVYEYCNLHGLWKI